uniref:Uncharacterized protein n=1 Tax=Rhipicephalus zambeziensis TaxID=60191 RepID=A0A224YCP6_9ACAR
MCIVFMLSGVLYLLYVLFQHSVAKISDLSCFAFAHWLCLFTVTPSLFLYSCCVFCSCCFENVPILFCLFLFIHFMSYIVYLCFWAFVTVETCLKTYLICKSCIVRLSWFVGPELASSFFFFFCIPGTVCSFI